MNKTEIKWTDFTWNPVSGCVPISPGCAFCYAKRIAESNPTAFKNGFGITLRPHKLSEPRKLTKPSIVFVNSMSDLFWDQIPTDYRHQILREIERCPEHVFQILTKRPDNMLEYFKGWNVPKNVWLGVTVEDKENMSRVDILKQINTPRRFISFEPILEDIGVVDLSGIAWAIVGGESGPHLTNEKQAEKRGLVRYMDGKWIPREDRIHWVTNIQKACALSDTVFFFKQWGGPFSGSAGGLLNGIKYENFPNWFIS